MSSGNIENASAAFKVRAPPPARTYSEAATQSTRQQQVKSREKNPPPTRNLAHHHRRQYSTHKKPAPPPKGKGKEAAEAAVPARPRHSPTPKKVALPPKGNGKDSAEATKPAVVAPPSEPPENTALTQARAVFLHAAPTKYNPGLMRRWIEEDNKRTKM
ncbi:hypothetical protein BGX38DRAFT_1145707 [Terfezia claveryi]|nr:hypothetical protein BGX38DRAFT_1145707 [Terfezia claveryi]